jgi:tRNA dimethylallyltransferase
MKTPLVIIVGPTASGKSDLAVSLAKQLHGEIISADSRQVYRGLTIGTGKITRREMKGVRHHLLDVADPRRRFNAERYRTLAQKALADIAARSTPKQLITPIIVGGTGFYIEALLDEHSLSLVPPNESLRRMLDKKSPEQLLTLLKKHNPKRWRVMSNSPSESKNTRRIIRAIEIAIALKKMPAIKPPKKGLHMNAYVPLFIGIKIHQDILKKRIRVRLLKRIRAGMIDEARRLHEPRSARNPFGGISWRRMDELGLEYRYLARYLRGQLSKAEMIEKLNTEIWHYAQRQITWFKRNKKIRWITPINMRKNRYLTKVLKMVG